MARYSNLDLNDKNIFGGEMKNTTLGLKWLPHSNVAFIANYIHQNTDRRAVTTNDDPDIWMMRAQFDF
jgi:phosphate-selective porin OprO/OprP